MGRKNKLVCILRCSKHSKRGYARFTDSQRKAPSGKELAAKLIEGGTLLLSFVLLSLIKAYEALHLCPQMQNTAYLFRDTPYFKKLSFKVRP